jgi:hypothetical protein
MISDNADESVVNMKMFKKYLQDNKYPIECIQCDFYTVSGYFTDFPFSFFFSLWLDSDYS